MHEDPPRPARRRRVHRRHLFPLSGYHVAIAGIAQPNAAGVALQAKRGVIQVALFCEVGRKFGRWVDVGYWQRILDAGH